MKLINALVYSLIFCLSFVSVAEAKSRSGSFKGGFSSQKRNAPKPAKTYYTPAPKPKVAATAPPGNASFGAFGNSKTGDAKATNGTFQQSQMSKDLDTNAARANALKTADTRNTTDTGFGNNGNGNSKTNSNNGWFGGDRRSHTQSQPQYTQPTTVVHERSGGFLNGVMWFMLGNSLAHHNTQYVPINNQVGTAGNNQVGTAGVENGSSEAGNISQQNQTAPVDESESFFMKLLRFILWIAVISGVIWTVRKVMRLRKNGFNKTANYTL